MKYYAGLDVSNIETSICIVDEENKIIKEGKVASDPECIHIYLQKSELSFEAIGLETGSLSHWLVTGLRASGWNTICIDSRCMAAILATNVNKTDRNDARSIAKAIRCKNYKEVHIKSLEAVQLNSLLTTRKALVHQKTTLYNTVRGILKTFGIKLPRGIKSMRRAIAEAIAFDEYLPEEKRKAHHVNWETIEALIICHESANTQLEILDAKLNVHKEDPVIKRFLTHPGVGIVTAVTFKAEIDDPHRFKKSRSVGAYLGMTPRQYSSGETIKQGRVSKQGSAELRALLHEAGVVVLSRTKAKSKLRTWGLKKKQKLKTQKAAMAVGRKIAINLHQMWLNDRDFDPQIDVEEFYSEKIDCRSEHKEWKASQRLEKTKSMKTKPKKREAKTKAA